jgi:Ca-activated chloride channel family protein
VPESARILLLSDGANRTGRPVADALQEVTAAKVPVYAIALGTPDGTLGPGRAVPPSPETMKQIADSTGGQAFESKDAESVSKVYDDLGSFIGSTREQHEVTDWAVALAMALFAAAGLAWWRWGVRLG